MLCYTGNSTGSAPAVSMATPRRTAFFVSDRTGITAEMLGHSRLTQFDGVG